MIYIYVLDIMMDKLILFNYNKLEFYKILWIILIDKLKNYK